MTVAAFYKLNHQERASLLRECCGSKHWVDDMLQAPPVPDIKEMLNMAEEKWKACTDADAKEAFSHHPKIGDLEALRKKFVADRFAANEQGTVRDAPDQLIERLAEANRLYEKKFGYIFIVCATGKSAAEMLELLLERLEHNAEEEIEIAKEEQLKITKLRLQKLFSA
jgi:2-oxo-4-hydroxy-4-carboxy-5-ureidoimidazoline decarboxylase